MKNCIALLNAFPSALQLQYVTYVLANQEDTCAEIRLDRKLVSDYITFGYYSLGGTVNLCTPLC